MIELVNEKHNNEFCFLDTISILSRKIHNKDIIENNGVKWVEIIGAKIINLNPLQPLLDFKCIRATPEEYCKREIDWYESCDRSIINHVDDIKIWNQVATKDDKKEINSNYGWCIFSEENYNQYNNCINELKQLQNSRRAVMIYNRPSMWVDHNRNGMNDFMCTLAVQCFIRNGKLVYVINQRSLDFYISGIGSDFYWHCYVAQKMMKDLNLDDGNIIWLVNNLHVYEQHFEKILKIKENY